MHKLPLHLQTEKGPFKYYITMITPDALWGSRRGEWWVIYALLDILVYIGFIREIRKNQTNKLYWGEWQKSIT